METGDAESFCPEILHWIITLFPLFPFKCRQRAGWACTGLWWQHFYTMTGIFFWNLRGLLFIWLHRYYILELRDNLKEKQAWSSIFHERQLQTVCCLANEHWLLMLEFSGTRIHKQITNSCAINEKNPNKPSTFWVSTFICRMKPNDDARSNNVSFYYTNINFTLVRTKESQMTHVTHLFIFSQETRP